jgi:LmbE family N-acetylglucosaminyl deacetylase
MSAGGDFDKASLQRIEETKSFWSDINNALVVDSRDVFIKSTTEDQLVNWVETHKLVYDSILTPPADDFHFEHKIISSVGRALTRKKKISHLEYNTPSTSHTWSANVFVDVTEHYEKKVQLLKLFETQQSRNYFSDDCIESFHTNYFSNKREVGYTEQFKIDFLFL